MSIKDIINSLNKHKRPFIQYGMSNVTEAFLFDVSIVRGQVNRFDFFSFGSI